MRLAAVLLAILVLALLAEVLPLVPIPTPKPPDYAQPSAWLCRPGRDDVCARPTTATVFAPDGGRSVVTYKPDPAAPIDCFYVYPTVSRARSDNAPIAATAEEIGAAQKQLARFSPACAGRSRRSTARSPARASARSSRIPTPRRARSPMPTCAPPGTPTSPTDNHGRGVVLIGHSQGAKLLARLMAAEIDGQPVQARLVSAIIPGTRVDVPVRGAKATTEAAARSSTSRSAATRSQTGCVIAYSTYPADRPVPADAVFGATRTPGMVYACVDPAAVAGTPTLDADLPLWGELRAKLGTDFAELPGLLDASCKREGRFSILAIAAKPSDRVGEQTGALLERLAEYAPAWGLHGLDIALAEGTLVDHRASPSRRLRPPLRTPCSEKPAAAATSARAASRSRRSSVRWS